MKKRGIACSLAIAVMAASILGGCGSSNTQSTTRTSAATARTGEDALKKGAQGMSKDVSQEISEAASGKDYYNTPDVAGAGNLTLDMVITPLGDSDGGPYLRGVMEDYMGMHPNVRLDPVECFMNDSYITLATQVTVGALPDIFTMTEAYFASYLEMGMNADNMDELLEEEYLEGLMPAAIKNAAVDGSLIYMLWQNNITAMAYRKDLPEEKGVQIPKTWNEFLEAAKALAEDLDGGDKVDRYGCVFAGTRDDSAESRFQTFTLTYGCDFVMENGDGTFTSGLGTNAYRNAMTFFTGLATNKGVTPPGLAGTEYSEAYTMITTDQACIFFSASNVPDGIYSTNLEMQEKMGSPWMPTAEGADPVTSFSSAGVTVSSTCKNPEVAADFLKYIASADNSVAWDEATCRLPAVKNVLTAIYERGSVYSGFAEALDSVVIYPASVGPAELRDIRGERWQTAVLEGAPVDETIVTTAAKAENVAKSYSN